MGMSFLETLFTGYSAMQAVVVIFLIIVAGLVLGRIKVAGISLGVTFVFFCGILAGHFGLSVDPKMLTFAQNFGLIIFVYALGLQVGPGFFNAFRKGGMELNVLGMGVILIGTFMAVAFTWFTPVSLPDMIGVLCGATTNTPALGAAQQTLDQLGMDSTSPALGCAVTYPLGVVGVILAMVLLRKTVVRPKDLENRPVRGEATYIATFRILNPAVIGKSLPEIAHLTPDHFIISRIWREGSLILPDSTICLQENDRVLVVTTEQEVAGLTLIFGEQEKTDWNSEGIDWNALDSQLSSHRILVTRPEINGKSLGSLKLRNRFGVNVTRIYRGDIALLATPDRILRMGDKVVTVGSEENIAAVEKELGNAVRNLREPNLVSICLGIIFGLVLGAIPFAVPGVSAPVRLGLAGGPIIAGILVGAFGPRIHMVAYTTESANLMLRRLGLAMYLACLGLDAGARFFETVFRPEGLLWVGLGFAITVIPVLVMGWVSLKCFHLDFGTVTGMLCGSMANPMALTYASDTIPNDNPALCYAQVYPLCMFLRVIIAQVVLVLLV